MRKSQTHLWLAIALCAVAVVYGMGAGWYGPLTVSALGVGVAAPASGELTVSKLVEMQEVANTTRANTDNLGFINVGGGELWAVSDSGNCALRTANFSGYQVTARNKLIADGPTIHTPADVTISSGAIAAPTKGFLRLECESGTTDTLSTIGAGSDGQMLILCNKTAGDVITLDENGNIRMYDTSRVLDTTADLMALIYNAGAGYWCQIQIGNNN